MENVSEVQSTVIEQVTSSVQPVCDTCLWRNIFCASTSEIFLFPKCFLCSPVIYTLKQSKKKENFKLKKWNKSYYQEEKKNPTCDRQNAWWDFVNLLQQIKRQTRVSDTRRSYLPDPIIRTSEWPETQWEAKFLWLRAAPNPLLLACSNYEDIFSVINKTAHKYLYDPWCTGSQNGAVAIQRWNKCRTGSLQL